MSLTAYGAVDLSCATVPDISTRRLWEEVRRDVKLYNAESLPKIVFDYKFGVFLLDKQVPDDDILDFLREPLPSHQECLLGRWIAWMLGFEQLLKDDVIKHDEALLELAGRHGSPSPLAQFLFESSTSFTWYDICTSGWPFFRILDRLRKVVFEYVASTQAVPRIAAPQVVRLREAIGILKSGIRARRAVGDVEHAVVHILRSAVTRNEAILAVLQVDMQEGLFEALYQSFLPELVLLQLPRAARAFRGYTAAATMSERAKKCGRFAHCTAMRADSRGKRRARAAVAGLGSRLRCGVLIHLKPTIDFLSETVRTRCRLMCNPILLKTIWEYHLSRPEGVIHWVDVGAALGDCALFASALLPQGHLQVLSYEANQETIPYLRSSVALSGLDGRFTLKSESRQSNISSIEVRGAFVGAPSMKEVQVCNSHFGLSVMRQTNCKGHAMAPISTSSLDWELRELGDGADVDVLSVFVNGAELNVLRGARELLMTGRIRCVLVVRDHNITLQSIQSILESSGYQMELRESALVASPLAEIHRRGGRICEAPSLEANSDGA